MAIAGFEDLHSTIVGRIAEKVCRAHRFYVLQQEIIKDLDTEYDTSRDMDFMINDEVKRIEFKGDNYPKGNNLALEIQQENLKGYMVPSGIATSESPEWDIYCFRKDTIYTFDLEQVDRIVYNNTVRDFHYKICNRDSNTGKTLCIVIDIDILIEEGFFKATHKNVLSSLDNAGVSRENLGIQGLKEEDERPA